MMRRAGSWAQAGVVVFALTAVVVLAMMLAARFSLRADLTATGEHRLSERTMRALQDLQSGVTVVVAAEIGQVPRENAQRLRDVLDALGHASPKVRVRLLDTASGGGQGQFDAVLNQLREEDAGVIAEHVAATQAAVAELRGIAGKVNELAGALGGFRDRLGAVAQAMGGASVTEVERLKQVWDGQAAQLRVLADSTEKAAREAEGLLGQRMTAIDVPRVDDAVRAIRTAADEVTLAAATTAEAITSRGMRLLSGPGISQAIAASPEMAAARTSGGEAEAATAAIRDRAARLNAALAKMGTLRVARVASAISRNRAALMIASPTSDGEKPGEAIAERASVSAVDVDQLLGLVADRSGQAVGATAVDRGRMEDLLAAGLAAFGSGQRALVVFTHAETGKLEPAYAPVRRLVERLALRGIDVAEWRVAGGEKPAAIAEAERSGRPVVYVTLSPEVRGSESAVAMGKLAEVIRDLIKDRKPLLLSVNPSSLPTTGSEDPLTAFLKPLGLEADSGRVLLREVRTAGGRVVETELAVVDPGTNHPVAGAVAGIKTRLVWPIPLTVAAAGEQGTKVTPVITVPAGPGLWAESEWQAYRAARGNPSQAAPPRADSPRDQAGGPGPWLLAAAVEQSEASGRVLVVGSNGWYLDPIAEQTVDVNGRLVQDNPGNAELFLAGVQWLSGQEARIASGGESRSVARIPALSDGQLSALRWGLGGLLPVLVLLAGAAWRMFRG